MIDYARVIAWVLVSLVSAAAGAAELPSDNDDTMRVKPVASDKGPAPQQSDKTQQTENKPQEEADDAVLDLAQPDFTIVNLPTTLAVPRYKSAFRVTHRFGRPLGQGDFGDLVEDLFGFDSGALIGLEYRFGLIRGGQVGIHRTSNKTIQFFAEYLALRQSSGRPVSVAVIATAEGTNNFRDSKSPAVGAIISRTIRERAALYVEPIWINNTNPLPSELTEDNSTFVLGVAGRLRIRPTVYLVLEAVPRLGGDSPGKQLISFGVEKRVGGHAFQLNFSNSFGTTLAQIARGGAN
ncbi:MAG: DUF5777 family beta-barrel protein, partial [Acidimicrobiia bacterium]